MIYIYIYRKRESERDEREREKEKEREREGERERERERETSAVWSIGVGDGKDDATEAAMASSFRSTCAILSMMAMRPIIFSACNGSQGHIPDL